MNFDKNIIFSLIKVAFKEKTTIEVIGTCETKEYFLIIYIKIVTISSIIGTIGTTCSKITIEKIRPLWVVESKVKK